MKIKLIKDNISELTFKNIEPNKINFLIAHNGLGKSTIYNILNSKKIENYKLKINDNAFNKNLIRIKCLRQEKYAKKRKVGGYTQPVIDNKPKMLLKLNQKYEKKDILKILSKYERRKINLDKLYPVDKFNNFKKMQIVVQKIKKNKWFQEYINKDKPSIEIFCNKANNYMSKDVMNNFILNFKSLLSINFKLLLKMLLNIDIKKLKSHFADKSKDDAIEKVQIYFDKTFPELKNKYNIKKNKRKYILNIDKEISRGQTDLIYNAFSVYIGFDNVVKNISFEDKDWMIIIDEAFDYLDQPNIIFTLKWLKEALSNVLKTNPKRKLYCLITTHLDPRIFWTIKSSKYYNFVVAQNMMHDCTSKDSQCNVLGKITSWRDKLPESIHIQKDGQMDINQSKIFQQGKENFNVFITNQGNGLCPAAISFYIRIYLEKKLFNNNCYSVDFVNNYLRQKNKNMTLFIKDKLEISSQTPDWFNSFLLIAPILNQIIHPETKSISKLTFKSIAYCLGSEPIRLILNNLIK